MITMEEALNAKEFHDNVKKNYDGTCQRWRRNGETKTWKTRPEEFLIPVKHGMYDHGRITQNVAQHFHTAENCPNAKKNEEENRKHQT